VLCAAGIANNDGRLREDFQVNPRELGSFMIAVERHKVALQRLFGMPPRASSAKMPTKLLNEVLDLVGQRVKPVGRSQKDGDDVVIYGLDADRFAEVMYYVEKRLARPDPKAAQEGDQ
jgi:hypothetical protein